MKFFSYDKKAVSLDNIRSFKRGTGMSSGKYRFEVMITYTNNTVEVFNNLTEEQAKEVYNNMLKTLNNDKE